MIKGISSLFILLIAFSLQAQETTPQKGPFKIDTTLVLSLDHTIKTFYNVISAKKNTDRNWKQFKFLFKKDAKLIPTGKDKMGLYHVNYMSPEEYIKKSSDWFKTNDFFEKEVHRKTNTFGNITQVFSTFEAYHKATDKTPYLRGVRSFQLLYDGTRWWIINVFWTQELHENFVPEDLLLD